MNNERFNASNLPQNTDGLVVNDVPLAEIIASAGRTPLYVYDTKIIESRIAALRAALSGQISIHYAVKANPMPDLLSHLLPLVDGYDVASKGELQRVLATGAKPSTVSFAGPGKSDDELKAAILGEIHISVESSGELQRCERIAVDLGKSVNICLRVNPAFELKSSGMKMTGRPSQFGIDTDQVIALLSNHSSALVNIVGLHIYSGSQNLNTDALIEAGTQTLDLAAELAAHNRATFKFINIGGGFGIPYFAHETAFDLSRVAEALLNKRRHLDIFSETEVILELGRYLVGEAGYYVCSVIDVKVSRGEKFVVVDGGLHHHLANSGNFGQTLRKNYPVFVANKLSAQNVEEVTIVGRLCTPLDIIASKLALPEIEVGDQIVVAQSGAYGYSASPLKFLGHEEPAEVLI